MRTAVASQSPFEPKLSLPSPRRLSGAQFLLTLGIRVRDLRNRRGMTRKTLAHESNVSERHLAQLESGEGNISVLLLRRVATVLNVSLEELFAADHQGNELGDDVEHGMTIINRRLAWFFQSALRHPPQPCPTPRARGDIASRMPPQYLV